MSNDNSTKSCFKCNEVKSLKDFPKRKSAKDGRRNACNVCTNEFIRQWKTETGYKRKPKPKKGRFSLPPEERKRRARERSRKYRAANREKVLQGLREWKEQNKEHVLEYQRRYRAENAEYLRAQAIRYYNENREWYIEKLRLWREANPDYWREWVKNNRERAAQVARNRRYRQKGAEGSFTDAEWIELCAVTGDKCLACGRSDVPLTRDHVVPLVHGGTNNIENIQPLCISCNSSKGARYIDYRGEANGKA